jgi:integrase
MFKRGKIWWFSIDGVKESSGTNIKADAERLYRKRKQEAFDRKHGFYIKTWDEACLERLQSHQHLASYSKDVIQAAWWLPHLTGRKVDTLTKDFVHGIIAANRPINEKEPSKQNRTANAYAQFVTKVIRSAGVIAPKFRVYPVIKGGKRWLRREEWEALLLHMDDDLRHICTFALATGLRQANVMHFEWGWIHETAAYLPAAVTKTERDYGIPLSSVSQGVIAERRAAKVRHQQYVFTDAGKPWYKIRLLRRLYKAVKAAEIEPMVFHTFRHTFASWLAQAGVSDAVRRRLGCWDMGGGAAGGYVHFDVESLRPFSERVFQKQEERRVATI